MLDVYNKDYRNLIELRLGKKLVTQCIKHLCTKVCYSPKVLAQKKAFLKPIETFILALNFYTAFYVGEVPWSKKPQTLHTRAR